jgi:hypothetical protein
MATITLHYDVHDRPAKQMTDRMLSPGLTKHKKTGLEEALEDVANGRVTTIHTPKQWKRK